MRSNRIILFDLDGTLTVNGVKGAVEACCQHLAERLSFPYDRVREIWREVSRETWTNGRKDFDSETSLWTLILEGTLSRLDAIDELDTESLVQTLIQKRQDLSVPYPETHDVLTRLARDYRLGVVTNGYSSLQHDKIEKAGLSRFFAGVWVSKSVGIEKPHTQIFEVAIQFFGCEPCEAVFVGDTPEADIAGAQAAGLNPVWINRDDLSPPDSVPISVEIRSLTELPGLLGKEENLD